MENGGPASRQGNEGGRACGPLRVRVEGATALPYLGNLAGSHFSCAALPWESIQSPPGHATDERPALTLPHEPVRALRVPDLGQSFTGQGHPPGAFDIWRHEPSSTTGMFWTCPCGCGHLQFMMFPPCSPPFWLWDGNEEEPTVTPIVENRTRRGTSLPVPHWRGTLTKGYWTPA